MHHQRYHQLRKGEDDEEAQSLVDECGSAGYYKRTRPKLLALLFLSLLSCCFVLAPCLFSFPICEPFFLSFFFFSFAGFRCFLCFLFAFFVLSRGLCSGFADSFGEYDGPVAEMDAKTPLCSSISNG